MNFVTHFPRSTKGHNAILLIIDLLTKSAHFLVVNLRMSMDKLT